MLRSLGYAVLTAAGPKEALALAQEHAAPIDLLLTDVVMPEMHGSELAKAFRVLRPTAAVVFVSGHARDAFAKGTGEIVNYLGKPFSREELGERLREALRASTSPTSRNSSGGS